MYSLRQIEHIVKDYADALPLDVFAFFGSFIEEIVPPIPAALIMTTAGSLALAQQHTWLFLVWLAVAGSIGKTIASWIFYVAGERFEHSVVGRFGKYVGIKPQDVESLGKRFGGGWGDDLVLFAMRAVPVFPSVSVSLVCGVIRFRKKTFLAATFLGIIVRNALFLSIGYGGVRTARFLVRKVHETQFWVGVAFIFLSVVFIYWLARKRRIRSSSRED
jgi:membrane protein DedA with SNARE-associated domain